MILQNATTSNILQILFRDLIGLTLAVMCKGDEWKKAVLMLCCYISWQITSSGQTKGHRCCQTNGYLLSLSVFLSSPLLSLCFSGSVLQWTAEDKCRRTHDIFPHSERKQNIVPSSRTLSTETGKAVASPLTCDFFKGSSGLQ